jgi:hypothetical protein
MRFAWGHLPSQPLSCSTECRNLWKLLLDCWEGEASIRPTASEIVERLVDPTIGATAKATTTQSTTDWDDKFTSKFRRSLQGDPILPSVTQIEHMLFGDG